MHGKAGEEEHRQFQEGRTARLLTKRVTTHMLKSVELTFYQMLNLTALHLGLGQ